MQVGVVGEGEEWQLIHQLPNEPDARSMEVPDLNPFTYYRYGAQRRGAACAAVGSALAACPHPCACPLSAWLSFRMRQVNIVGTSPPSQPSRKIQTLQAPPDTAPANVTLRTASETSLWLRWMVRLPQARRGPWGWDVCLRLIALQKWASAGSPPASFSLLAVSLSQTNKCST